MSRSSHHKDRNGRSSGIFVGHHEEGTAARTRPLSFDEIMSKREKKKKHLEGEKRAVEDMTRNDEISQVSKKDKEQSKESKNPSSSNKKHVKEEAAKTSSRRNKENTSVKDDNADKIQGRRIGDSESNLKAKSDKDLKSKVQIEEKKHERRKSDERKTIVTENSNKHARDSLLIGRHVDGSRGKHERGDKGKDRNVADERNRDRHPRKKDDIGKGHHDGATSDRKEMKELSKSRYDESKMKRKRSRSREGGERNRRSISPLSKSQKRASYRGKEHEEFTLYTNKGKSERQHSDAEWSKNKSNGSSGQHKRHGGSTSGLGGYSPRKRRSEAGAKTPSPPKRSPEKKNAKWDTAPPESQNTLSVSATSDFQLPNKVISVNIHELGTIPIPANTAKPFSGVPSSFLLANKNNSGDPVQLTQATRPRRRLYLENIPPAASEKAVIEWLNNLLIASGFNHIKGTHPCISCIINKEKGQALVEFLTPEDASAALHFDGIIFSGSIIKIRRPKDYVESATGEPEKSVAAVEMVSNIVKDSPHKIFIGGISKRLSSEMIMEIASSFGQLKAYHFENNYDQNGPHAFLEYADKSVTSKACAGLNGMKLGGQVLTVLRVYPNASTLENNANLPFYGIPDHAKPLLAQPTPVLQLKNVFDPEYLPSLTEAEIEEVLEDIRLECARFGSVKSVNFVKYSSTQDKEFTQSPTNLELDVTNTKTDIAKSESVEDDKHGSNTVVKESSQPGQIESLASQELTKQEPYDESKEGEMPKMPLEVESNMEEGKGDMKGRDCNLGHVFEAGGVFVEFRREEASCAAAHCLHGRSFDNRIVTIEYVPLDVYRSRFPKQIHGCNRFVFEIE